MPTRITEKQNPKSAALDLKPTLEILRIINREDRKVALAVAQALPQIARAVDLAADALAAGGRMIYCGAGTSGRLGVLDAAEAIPTFGTTRIIAVLAGGPRAMFRPTEGSEDDPQQAGSDLRRVKLTARDVVVGISASGHTPYTLGAIRRAKKVGAKTVAVSSNPSAPLCRLAHVAIVADVGPEVIAGSSRMKAGTAAKLVLNMLSTATMVRHGRVLSSWMVNVQLRNRKLWKRGKSILMRATGAGAARAEAALKDSGRSLPVAMLMILKNVSRQEAVKSLGKEQNLSRALRRAGARFEGQACNS